MIRSMTAYGRAFSSTSLGKWVVEIHSVNKRGLDFQIFMPKDFLQFDLEIRKLLSSFIHRGQVTVKIFLQSETGLGTLSRLTSFKNGLEKMAQSLGFDPDQITLPFLYEQSKGLPADLDEVEDEMKRDLHQVLQSALNPFVQMREQEGKALAIAFEKHLKVLKDLLSEVENLAEGITERYRKKILDKLVEFKEVFTEDRERILREVFFYTEKSDVTEEIIRLKSHIEQFFSLLYSEERCVGKTMDFLVQEMGREINTLSSKSDELELSKRTLKMKSELEKIREQVQNVE